MKIKYLMMGAVFILIYNNAAAYDHNHSQWDTLLKKNVVVLNEGRVSKVNYSDFKKELPLLDRYLESLSSVSRDDYLLWTKKQQLSFLINSYNAFTIKLILEHYPVKSIKDIGSFFKSPWKIEFISLLGRMVSLDDIEHNMIRAQGVFDEPRIHVALVCASVGCPALKNRAFTPDNLEMLLESGLVDFLSDKTRNRFNRDKGVFEVSKIFKWYGDDFKKRYGSVHGLVKKYQKYLVSSREELLTVKQKEVKVKFLDYDWNLNGIE